MKKSEADVLLKNCKQVIDMCMLEKAGPLDAAMNVSINMSLGIAKHMLSVGAGDVDFIVARLAVDYKQALLQHLGAKQ